MQYLLFNPDRRVAAAAEHLLERLGLGPQLLEGGDHPRDHVRLAHHGEAEPAFAWYFPTADLTKRFYDR